MAFSYFLESQLGLGLQLYPVYQEILLGSHEEDKARASLVLPQCILQPLPGMNRVGTRGLDLARRYREGTLTYPDHVEAGAGPGTASAGPKGAGKYWHWFGRGEDSYCRS